MRYCCWVLGGLVLGLLSLGLEGLVLGQCLQWHYRLPSARSRLMVCALMMAIGRNQGRRQAQLALLFSIAMCCMGIDEGTDCAVLCHAVWSPGPAAPPC